jgi:hypothetical protein
MVGRRVALAFALAVVAVLGAVVLTQPALATVTSSTRSVTYSPSVNTTGFSVTFPFLDASWIKVTKITEATGVETVLTQGTDYTVQVPRAGSNGIVTTTVAVTSAYTLRIERVVPLTQTTSFRSQGTFRAAAHEDAFDKLTMALQQVQSGLASSITQSDIDSAVATHAAAADAHNVYAKLAGRSGGQHLRGGTAAGESMQISSTTNATKGSVSIGSGGNELYVDDVNNRVGINDSTPSVALDVTGAAAISTTCTVPTVYGSAASGGDLTLYSTSNATKGNIYFGTSSYDEVNNRLGIGDATPDNPLDIVAASNYPAINIENTTGYDLSIDAFEIFQVSSANDAELAIASGSTFQLTTNSAGVLIYGDAHATKAGDLGLFGDVVLIADTWTNSESSSNVAIDSSGVRIKTGALQQWLHETQTAVIAETFTAPDDCGDIMFANVDNTVIQLPDAAAANKGCEITVINNAADAAALVSLSPHATDGIDGSCVGIDGAGAATVVIFSGTVNKDIRNTKATQEKGDYVKLISDGTAGWFVTGCVGEWASEP